MSTLLRLYSLAVVVTFAVAGCSQGDGGGAPEAATEASSPATAQAGVVLSTPPSVVAAQPVGVSQQSILANAPRTAPTPVDPIAVMRTSHGNIYIRLYGSKAQRTVSNFVDYVMNGHYDGTIFHQVDAGYAILGGGYDAKLKPKPGRYPIRNEADNGLKNVRGTVAMARDPKDPHSATSEFFINLVDNPQLDHRGDMPETFGYCVFGEVVEGMDVVQKIAAEKTATLRSFDKLPVQTVTVDHVRFVR